MLQSFHIQNFKCLRDTTLELGPFTVLIGPNDSGKTSILDALRLLGQTFTHPWLEVLSAANLGTVLTWRREAGEIQWQLTFQDLEDHFTYKFSYPSAIERGQSKRFGTFDRYKDGQFAASAMTNSGLRTHSLQLKERATGLQTLRELPGSYPIKAEIQRFTLNLIDLPRYRLDPDALRTPAVPQPDAVLSPSGDNLVAVLDRLISGPDRTAIVELERKLHAAIPTLRGISLRTAEAGKKSLEFVLAGPGKPLTTIPCAHASDGAMLLTAYLALAYSEQPGMLLIEEPENGLHPSRLQAVVEMLRKLSTGEVGPRPRQVILTTHSPLLLNYAKPEEVRIVRRDPESGTNITALTAVPDITKLLEEFGIGELWFLLGEDALVNGKKP